MTRLSLIHITESLSQYTREYNAVFIIETKLNIIILDLLSCVTLGEEREEVSALIMEILS